MPARNKDQQMALIPKAVSGRRMIVLLLAQNVNEIIRRSVKSRTKFEFMVARTRFRVTFFAGSGVQQKGGYE